MAYAPPITTTRAAAILSHCTRIHVERRVGCSRNRSSTLRAVASTSNRAAGPAPSRFAASIIASSFISRSPSIAAPHGGNAPALPLASSPTPPRYLRTRVLAARATERLRAVAAAAPVNRLPISLPPHSLPHARADRPSHRGLVRPTGSPPAASCDGRNP